MEARARRLEYSAITLGTILVMAFVLVQPTQQTYAVGLEGLPGYDDCNIHRFPSNQPEDPVSMNTVKNKNIVKTIYAEKEVFSCFLDQGDLPVIVDVTTYIEIYENIDDREIIETNAIATTCLKEPLFPFGGGATVIDCESYPIPSTPVFVGSNCEEFNVFTHPQEMNTVTKGNIAKTVESQKEIFLCALDGAQVCIDAPPCASTVKKVEVILFTDIYEDLATQEVEEVQFHSMRCVVLITDEAFIRDPDKVLQDATVETCQFSSIEN
ncbi:MAG: hypothetical protein HMLIMOIP_000444 [Candidatus Nitrosomirales archaeon]|jgi:hypothetical protein